VAAYRAVDAAGLLVAGARRTANADGSADVAHQPGSAFEAVHTSLTNATTRELQLHGFAAEGHSGAGDAAVSSGTRQASPQAEAAATRLGGAGFHVCLYGRTSCGDLGATGNVQGRSARAAGAAFVHVELAKVVRDDQARRRLAAELAAAALS